MVLKLYPELGAWHWMYGVLVIPGLVVFGLRTRLPESAHWLLARGQHESAHVNAKKLLGRPVSLVVRPTPTAAHTGGLGLGSLFSPRYLRATILAAVPWFLQDLATYGIGIFTPTILATLFTKTDHNLILKDIRAAEGSGVIDLFLLIGFMTSIPLVDKVGRIPLQITGFLGCAFGLGLASLSSALPDHELRIPLIFLGFMIFNFMTNLGPNAMTYVLAGEVFPTDMRGAGAGFAASFAKIGAVMTAFLFPIIRQDIGTSNLMVWLVLSSILGAIVTFLFRIEPNGKNLEELQ